MRTSFCHMTTAACTVAALACSSDGEPNGPDNSLCIIIEGSGQLVGDRSVLAGDGVFAFDDVDRPVEVGLYLFEMRDVEGGMRVDTQYQFTWENGDSFLTRDDAFFQPTIDVGVDRYTFKSEMLVVAGAGLFADQVGRKPLVLTATIEFGPPLTPGGRRTAEESFSVGGRVCPG